ADGQGFFGELGHENDRCAGKPAILG
ncbi:MAG: hypothetical protein RL295_1284, partial [Pseudomonadota bacterium]